MKLRCERDNLAEALALAGRAASSRGSPSTSGAGTSLKLVGDRLEVTGTDQDLSISSELAVAGAEDGSLVAPGRLLTDIVRALDAGAVTLEGDDDELRVVAGRSQFTLRVFRASDFPQLPAVAGEGVHVRAASLGEALRQVVKAASTEVHRPILTGVLMAAEMGGLRLVATDSYRLALKDLPDARGVLTEGQRVLVPSRALAELQRLISAESGSLVVHLGAHEVAFDLGHVHLRARLIEGEFPPYQQLIPMNYPNKLRASRDALLEGVRRVRLVARDSSRPTEAPTPVRILLRADMAQLSVVTPDAGQAVEEVDAKYEGEEMTIAFNPQYLAEGIEAVTSDEVLIETQDPGKPATIKPVEGSDYVYLLMPVRVA